MPPRTYWGGVGMDGRFVGLAVGERVPPEPQQNAIFRACNTAREQVMHFAESSN